MPVRFDDYEPAETDGRTLDLSEETNAGTILSFLLDHHEYGFTPTEIHEATGIARGSVSPTLIRLRDHGLVRHKGDRWAVEEDDRIAAYGGTHLSLEAVADRYGDDWYATNPGWEEDIEDLREERSSDEDE